MDAFSKCMSSMMPPKVAKPHPLDLEIQQRFLALDQPNMIQAEYAAAAIGSTAAASSASSASSPSAAASAAAFSSCLPLSSAASAPASARASWRS